MAGTHDVLGGEAMRYAVSHGFHVGVTDEALERHLDRVLEVLGDMGVQDADAGGSLASGDIEISVTVQAASLRSAQGAADDLVRQAIATAGGTVVERAGADPISSEGVPFSRRSVDAQVLSA
jgi:hypothetical protein